MDISAKEVQKILDNISEIKKDHQLYDMHVHPNEIIFNEYVYTQNPASSKLLSLSGATYRKPEITDIKLITSGEVKTVPTELTNPKIALMMSLARTYGHIGPDVIGQHMKLSGIDKVLLLHVSLSAAKQEICFKQIYEMYGEDDRFLLAYCLPADINIKDIRKHLINVKKDYNINAIKVHPNVTGMDLSKKYYVDIFEEILVAAKDLQLPIVLHGGRSNLISNPDFSSYAVVENLINIDFSLTSSDVIIAHAGLHHIDYIDQAARLKNISLLIEKFPNIGLDISALKMFEIEAVLNKIPIDRILFGSDALYIPQWRTLCVLFYFLKQKYKDYEDKFIKICSINPGRTIFN